MLNVNCDACEDIRETDPSLIVNGWSDSECTSMKNDTGLVASKGHDDCEDLTDMNDCMIGNLDADLEKYDVCDWKKFMHKFIPNLWTLESAIICAICGIWTNIHNLWAEIAKIWKAINDILEEIQNLWNNIRNILAKLRDYDSLFDLLCKTIDNILKLIRGNKPKIHYGYWLDSFKQKAWLLLIPDDGSITLDINKFRPAFCADVLDGAGCDANKKLGRYTVDWGYEDDVYPHMVGWGISDATPVTDREVIGVVPRSAVPEADMSTTRWKNMLREHNIFEWGTFHDDTIVHVMCYGYVVIDGVAFNTECAPYGENNLVIFAGPFIGGSHSGALEGSVTRQIRSYDA